MLHVSLRLYNWAGGFCPANNCMVWRRRGRDEFILTNCRAMEQNRLHLHKVRRPHSHKVRTLVPLTSDPDVSALNVCGSVEKGICAEKQNDVAAPPKRPQTGATGSQAVTYSRTGSVKGALSFSKSTQGVLHGHFHTCIATNLSREGLKSVSHACLLQGAGD